MKSKLGSLILILLASIWQIKAKPCNKSLIFSENECNTQIPLKRPNLTKKFKLQMEITPHLENIMDHSNPINNIKHLTSRDSKVTALQEFLIKPKLIDTLTLSAEKPRTREKQKENREDSIYLFIIILLYLINARKRFADKAINLIFFVVVLGASARPLSYDINSVNPGIAVGSSFLTGISAIKDVGYCTQAYVFAGTKYQYQISKYDKNSNLIATDTKGDVVGGLADIPTIKAVYDDNGGCVNFQLQVQTAKTGFFDKCTDVASCPEYTWNTPPVDRIRRLIKMASGSFIIVGLVDSAAAGVLAKITSTTALDWTQSVSGKQFWSAIDLENAKIGVIGVEGNNCFFGVYSEADGSSVAANTYSTIDGAALCIDVTKLADGSFIAIGTKDGKAFTLKLDSSYSLSSYQSFVTGTGLLFSVIQISSGAIIAAGQINSDTIGSTDGWLIEISNQGDLVWSANYGGTGFDRFYQLAEIKAMTVLCVGYSTSPPAVSNNANLYSVSVVLGCLKGERVNSDQNGCTPCEAGKYSDQFGADNCIYCPVGTYAANIGSPNCTKCGPGWYIDHEGSTECKKCQKHTYSSQAGSSLCTNCIEGYYQCTEGNSSCLKCPKRHCGACQLDDRELCVQLDGICWYDSSDKCERNSSISTDCLAAIYEICYDIWQSSNTNDPQCADFKNSFNMTLMELQPKILSAYYDTDGQSFLITFDQDMDPVWCLDAACIFDSNTMSWLPDPCSIQWDTPKILRVFYNPEVGIMPSFTVNPEALYIVYTYAMVEVVAVNYPVFFHNLFYVDCNAKN